MTLALSTTRDRTPQVYGTKCCEAKLRPCPQLEKMVSSSWNFLEAPQTLWAPVTVESHRDTVDWRRTKLFALHHSSNRCHASSNRCLTSSNKCIAIRNKCLTSSNNVCYHWQGRCHGLDDLDQMMIQNRLSPQSNT